MEKHGLLKSRWMTKENQIGYYKGRAAQAATATKSDSGPSQQLLDAAHKYVHYQMTAKEFHAATAHHPAAHVAKALGVPTSTVEANRAKHRTT